MANLLLPYIANPAPHISTPCIRTFPWQSLYTIFRVIWHRWLPVTTCCLVRTCKILIFALLWALYNHILVVHRNIILEFCFLFLLIMTGSGERSSWTTNTSSPSRELGQHTQAHGQVIFLPSFEGRYNPTTYLAWELEVEQVFSHQTFLNLSECEQPLEHLLILLLFGGVYIVRKTLITNPQLGKFWKL